MSRKTSQNQESVRTLYNQGKTASDIAKKLKISVQTVYYYLKRIKAEPVMAAAATEPTYEGFTKEEHEYTALDYLTQANAYRVEADKLEHMAWIALSSSRNVVANASGSPQDRFSEAAGRLT